MKEYFSRQIKLNKKMEEIGKTIKETRLKRGWSQEELADAAKINIKTIQRIENNKTVPREKTLRLIYDALNIEVVKSKKGINKYQFLSLTLTLILIAGSFMNWIYEFKHFHKGERVYRKLNGWNGHIKFNDYDFQNWILSLSSILIGVIVLSHAFHVLKNRLLYVAVPFFFTLLYVIGLLDGESGEIRPSLIIVLISTMLLMYLYWKKRKKTS